MARAEGTFHFYNTLGERTRFQVIVKGQQTGRTVSSSEQLTFKGTPWTQQLVGGKYHIRIEGRGWSRDLGWYDIDKEITEGNIYIGRDDQYWSLVETPSKNGGLQKVWMLQVPTSKDEMLSPKTIASIEPLKQANQINQIAHKPGRVFGITMHKCNEGIHVDSVNTGSAASRCINAAGKAIRLEPGDHILRWNGEIPNSVEQFQQMVSNSDQAQIVIKDGRTGQILTLSATLD
jgi:hypothetical protein